MALKVGVRVETPIGVGVIAERSHGELTNIRMYRVEYETEVEGSRWYYDAYNQWYFSQELKIVR